MLEALTIVLIISFVAICFAYRGLFKQQKTFTDYWYNEYKKLHSNYLSDIRSLMDSKDKREG